MKELTPENSMRRDYYTPRDAFGVFCFAVLGILAAQFLLTIVIWIVEAATGESGTTLRLQKESFLFVVGISVLNQVAFAGAYYIWHRTRKIDPLAPARVVRMDKRGYIMSAGLGVVILFAFMMSSFLYSYLFSLFGYYDAETALVFNTWPRYIAGILLVSALPAVFEELIFRGAMLRGLAPLGKWPAVLISVTAFTLMHMSPSQTIHQFLMGIVYALVVWETGSVVAGMIMHFLNNALVITLEFAGFFPLLEGISTLTLVLTAVTTLAAGIAIVLLVLWLYRRKSGRDTSADKGMIKLGEAAMREKGLVTYAVIPVLITALMWLVNLLDGMGVLAGL